MADPLDELFSALPAEFVARRDALAKRLRAEGRRDEAKEVKRLRRPTASVWALNQLAREHPEEVSELLAAGAELTAAQDALLAGDQSRFRPAVARHRELLSELAGLGVRLVEERAVSASDQRQDIANDLQAASTIPEAAEPFRLGRLPDHPATLGDPLTGLLGGSEAFAPTPAGDTVTTGGDAPGDHADGHDHDAADDDDHDAADADDADEDDERIERERAEAERAERERAEAERAERERAEAERAAADERIAAAQQVVDAARSDHEEVEREVRDLEAMLDRARRRLEDAGTRLTAAEDDLADALAARRRLGA